MADGLKRQEQTLLNDFVQTLLTPLSLRDISPFRGDKGEETNFVQTWVNPSVTS